MSDRYIPMTEPVSVDEAMASLRGKVRKGNKRIADLEAQLTAANARVEELEDENELLEDVLKKIHSWCEAYPDDIFTELEPEEWKDARGALDNIGIKLDRICASNMRHVLKGVEALAAARGE